MPVLTSDDLDAVPELSRSVGGGAEALFPEAEYRGRFRRTRSIALVVMIAALVGVGVVFGIGHDAKQPASQQPLASGGSSAIPHGEPSSEVVTRTASFNGTATDLNQVVATTLGAKPIFRTWQYAGGLRNTIINGVAYIANPDHKARICTPHCSFVSSPWLKVSGIYYAQQNSTVIYDPVLALGAVRKASGATFTNVGTRRLGGVTTTEYQGAFTPMGAQSTKRTARVGGIYEAMMNAFPQWSHPVPGENPPSGRVAIWVDGRGRARKIQINWTSDAVTVEQNPGRPAVTNRQIEHRQVDLSFGQFGKPVPTSPPNQRDVTEISEETAHDACTVYASGGGRWNC